MKTSGRYTVLIFILVSISLMAYSQDNRASRADRNEQRQWEKEQRKIEKEMLKEQAAEITKVMVDSQSSVTGVAYVRQSALLLILSWLIRRPLPCKLDRHSLLVTMVWEARHLMDE